MIYNYPTFESLGIDPEYLKLGTHEELQAYGAKDAAPSSRVQPEEPVRGGVKRPRRGYASKYVGVIKMKNKFYAVWAKGKDGQKGGFPLTEEGAEAAAWVRARALGRDWLEDREIRTKPCTMTPQEPFCADTLPEIPESTENEASVDGSRAHAPKSATPRRKLGGKRVA